MPLKDNEGCAVFGRPFCNDAGNSLHCAYNGTSMKPVLQDGDWLEVEPYCKQRVQVGDVIFFFPPRGDKHVVHRVVSVTQEGIGTRGDHCSQNDPWVLEPEVIVGRVVAACRGKKRHRVVGGPAGRIVGCLARCRHVVDRKMSALLRPVYHALSRLGLLCRLLPANLRPRVVTFHANHRMHEKILIGRRVVGSYDSDQGRWHIKRPFRLFVDESRLTK